MRNEKFNVGFKNPNFGSVHSPGPTFKNPNFESMDKMGKVIPHLSFTVENKMGNLLKKVWSRFKLIIDD